MSEEIEEHCARAWGPPSRRAAFEIAGVPAAVFKWDADANPQGVALYVSAGASEAVVDPDHPEHRHEYVVGLLPERDEVAHPLALLATYPARTGRRVSDGDSVRFEEPLWPGTGMSGFLVAAPARELLPPLLGPDGLHVAFVQAIPLYASEVELKGRLGAAGLLDHWESQRVPFWDPGRGPVDRPAE